MANHIPNFLTGMTVFIDGVGLLGKAKTVALPKVEQLRENFTSGGFERSVNTGVFKAMEAEITLSEFNKSLSSALNSNSPSFVIKGSIQQQTDKRPVVVTLRGGFDLDDGNLEQGKETERKLKIFVDYYSFELDGKTQVEMDVANMIAIIDGKDHLETMRKHIL